MYAIYGDQYNALLVLLTNIYEGILMGSPDPVMKASRSPVMATRQTVPGGPGNASWMGRWNNFL